MTRAVGLSAAIGACFPLPEMLLYFLWLLQLPEPPPHSGCPSVLLSSQLAGERQEKGFLGGSKG